MTRVAPVLALFGSSCLLGGQPSPGGTPGHASRYPCLLGFPVPGWPGRRQSSSPNVQPIDAPGGPRPVTCWKSFTSCPTMSYPLDREVSVGQMVDRRLGLGVVVVGGDDSADGLAVPQACG